MPVAQTVGSFRDRIDGGVLLLDAAMGTELDRRGVSTALPLWSARALIERPDIVRQIHLDNVLAGADIVTTNTFRTTTRTLRAAGERAARAESLTKLAVALALDARTHASRPATLIAGSLAPLEDCYSPWLTPPTPVAAREHLEQATWLAEAGVDFLMIETMPTIAEAEAALVAARSTGLPVTVGFVCQIDSPADGQVRLLNGELLRDAINRLDAYGPSAFLVNCSAPPVITRALQELAGYANRPCGGYANLGTVDPVSGWSSDESVSGQDYAIEAESWLGAGARLIGGCCGTSVRHTSALRRLIDYSGFPSSRSWTTRSK